MNDESPGIIQSIRRVYRSRRFWVGLAILYLGLFMAIQAKNWLPLHLFPSASNDQQIEYDLFIDSYAAGSILNIHLSPDYTGSLDVLVEGQHSFSTTLHFAGEEDPKHLWLPANSLNKANLRISGINPEKENLVIWIEFPKLGALLFVDSMLLFLAGLPIILFAFALSLVFADIRIMRYGYFLLIFIAIIATYIWGLPLLLRAPIATLATVVFLLIAFGFRLIRKRPL